MQMVTGYSPPTAGRITIDGLDLLCDPIAIKRRIGYLPENPPLYPELTVRRFLEFVADIKDVPRAKRAAQIDQAITRVNLSEVSGRRIGTLSKGFLQRIGLAQAIVNLALAQSALKQGGAAQETLMRAIGLQPRHAAAHYNLALLYEEERESGKALDHYRVFLQHAGAEHAAIVPEVSRRVAALQKKQAG